MARVIRRFSDEQIERANRIDVVEYARSQGLEIKRSGDWYKAKNQGGLYFYRKANTWHWETHDTGGNGAISLCMEFENKTWIEAVKSLLNEEMDSIRYAPDWKPEPEPPKEFHLPNKNDTYRHVFAYLTKTRGIDPGILKVLVDRGYIYENTQKSCVFVGRDKDGIARHASVRSTNTYGKVFKQDVPGSQKAYSFSISGTSGTLNVFEAPIDALSYISMQKFYGKQMKDSYVALGGVTDRALEQYLADHKNIEKIRICTDNDPYLNPAWNSESTPEKVMNIEKTNRVKELDDVVLFRTYGDYSRFIAKSEEIDIQYVAFPKKQLTLDNESDLYSINITADQEYNLYNSENDYLKGIGTKISGRQLYNQYFLKMPAGERAAYSINEKYREDYEVTRHRPIHKDFNEDLVALRQQQRNKEQSQSNVQTQPQNSKTVLTGEIQEQGRNDQKIPERINKTAEQTVPENTGQMKTANPALSKEVLQQAGISERLIEWYEAETDIFETKDGAMQIEGSSNWLIVCDNPVEVFAFMDKLEKEYMQTHSVNRYESTEHFLTYKNAEQVAAYVKEHPDISCIGVATSRTEAGELAFSQIEKLATHDIVVGRMSPKLMTHSQDVMQAHEINRALEKIPLKELQMEMAVGMEM